MALLTLTSTGTLGDHFPFLALGRRLVERGHIVRYAGPEYLRLHVESCGMQLHPTRREQDPTTVRNKPEAFDHWLPEKGGPPDVRDRTTGVNQPELHEKLGFDEMLEDVTAACAGADLLVCSRLQSIGRMVSDLAGIPWITVCVLPWLYPAPGTAAAAGIAAREERDATQPWTRRYRDRIHALRRQLGLAEVPVADERDLFVAPRVLLATHPLFGVPAVETGREIVQTGFWLHEPPHWEGRDPADSLANLLEGQPAPLVLAFSSQPLAHPERVLDLHLEAARLLRRPLVAQAGWAALRSDAFQSACARGEAALLTEGPQHRLFAQAAAVITHGGIGTVARAITAGTPLLIEPYGNDQFYNARQVVSLGLGAAVNPHQLTAPALAEVLETRVLTEENRSRASELAPHFDSNSALKTACVQIERWLHRQPD
ncbi:glycosyltransferase [Verrucomicrobium sp. BvORR034]|uniref:glycosyltransferase n=1 Tax=Verrucomicrobium sp. BvORR034 TaxID=1396418 RepID=UPI000678DE1D|nr:glycosyltransferase [Verrucomicrobium sp. BvORR034]